ncbi:zinc ABC transporter substrate-binding protein [Clostridium sp. BJN0001]|uniref:metal ABC transporter substrate-binding protein n=1 Tax=Clostridium sp. BJN0001 TaxID=2930219 RepID=UPI001FD21662|nr:zinc ABC transporter substrate-binding protein [Clostridium sp. BJN0001]
MKKLTFVMVIITIVLSLGMCIFSNPLSANTDNNIRTEARDKYLNIITVNKPQYYMVKKIIKDKHNVTYMMKDQNDIDEFQITENAVKNISNNDIFIYTGTDFEPWASKFIDKLEKGNISIVNLSRGIRLLNFNINGISEENPYYFENIDNYKIALYNVKSAIQDKDPANRDFYEDNYNEAIKQLDSEMEKFNYLKQEVSDFTFLTFDDRFQYFTNSIGIKTVKIQDDNIKQTIEDNKLDYKKVIVIDDGDEPSKVDLQDYWYVKLWKYYGDYSFERLIEYNMNEISKVIINNKAYYDKKNLNS